MSIICIAKGTATMGHTTIGHGGEVTSQEPAEMEGKQDG